MFKIGQRVRVKEWLDMPEKLEAAYGINSCNIGVVGVIKEALIESGVNSYMVEVDGNKYYRFHFEPELESVIKIGEQLLLFEL